MRWLLLLPLICPVAPQVHAACSPAGRLFFVQNQDRQQPGGRDRREEIKLTGELVEGGAECQRFRSAEGKFYTLEGNLRGFRAGDRVEITGYFPRASHCMQDTPFRVTAIRRVPAKD